MAKNIASVSSPAVGAAARLDLAAAGVSALGALLSTDASLVGVVYQLYGCLDPSAVTSSPNLVPLDTWTPQSAYPLVPQAPPQAPPCDGWPSLVIVRASAGTQTGSIYAGGEASGLPAAPSSAALSGLRPGDLATPIATPGAQVRLQLDAASTAASAVDLWTGNQALLNDTSTTSVAIATGSITLTLVAGTVFHVGDQVRVNYDATHYMDGAVIAIGAGPTVTVAVSAATGAGTYASWTLSYLLPSGYYYLGRLRGGGSSILAGEKTAYALGRYILASPASGAPLTLYAQATAASGAAGAGAATSQAATPNTIPVRDAFGEVFASALVGGPQQGGSVGIGPTSGTVTVIPDVPVAPGSSAGGISLSGVAGAAGTALLPGGAGSSIYLTSGAGGTTGGAGAGAAGNVNLNPAPGGQVLVNGKMLATANVLTKTGAYLAQHGDFVRVDTSSGDVTITMPGGNGARATARKVSSDSHYLRFAGLSADSGTVDTNTQGASVSTIGNGATAEVVH